VIQPYSTNSLKLFRNVFSYLPYLYVNILTIFRLHFLSYLYFLHTYILSIPGVLSALAGPPLSVAVCCNSPHCPVQGALMELGAAADPWGASAGASAAAAAAPVGSAGPSPPHTVPLPSASGPWGAAPVDPWAAASPASPQTVDPWGRASPPAVAPAPPDPWGETHNNVDPWGPTAGEWLLLLLARDVGLRVPGDRGGSTPPGGPQG